MDKELTLLEHLVELRKRIIISLLSLGIATLLTLPFASYVLNILKLPVAGVIDKLAFFSPEEAFLIYMRIGILSGLFLSMPVIAYQIWAFIEPAVDARIKRGVLSFIIFCSGAFILGGLFAYFILLPSALKFLLNIAQDQLQPVISASRYISFVSVLILGCGLVFQMPVLSLLLTKLGIIDAALLRKKYKYTIAIVFIIAAVITPTADAFNMLLLALPMLFLYEISIWVSYLTRPRKTI